MSRRRSTEFIARRFHDAIEKRTAHSPTWSQVPEPDRQALIEAFEELIRAGVIAPGSAPYSLIK